MPAAVVTGASRGLGLALADALAGRGWDLIVDARDADALEAARSRFERAGAASVVALAGDVTDPAHRRAIAGVVSVRGGLDVLVNNAGALGPSPLPRLAEVSPEQLRALYEVNVIAPLALAQLLLPSLRAAAGAVVNITSDAAVEAYEGWGAYGSSKAALDQWGAVLAAEDDAVRVYAFDPGDMRTQMHQDAYPGEDISDRPEPASVVPALLFVLDTAPPSGRLRASDLAVPGGAR